MDIETLAKAIADLTFDERTRLLRELDRRGVLLLEYSSRKPDRLGTLYEVFEDPTARGSYVLASPGFFDPPGGVRRS